MILKGLEVREGEESKLFFLETSSVLKDKNLKIFYVTLKNLLRLRESESEEKIPDP